MKSSLEWGSLCPPKCPLAAQPICPANPQGPPGILWDRWTQLLRGVFEPRLPALVPKWASTGFPGLAEGCGVEDAEEQAERRWEGVLKAW